MGTRVALALTPVLAILAGALAACHPSAATSIVVVTRMAGASAADVEAQITKPLESAVAGAAGVAGWTSQSRAGESTIVATLHAGVSGAGAITVVDDVRKAVAAVATHLPAGSEAPAIERVDPDTVVVAHLVVSADHLSRAEASAVARDVVAAGLEAVPGVARVTLHGEAHREIEVRVDGARARALNVSTAAVASVMRDVSAKSLLDLAAVEVMRVPAVHVSDVASLAEVVRDVDVGAIQRSTTDAVPALTIDVWKQSSASMVELQTALEAKLETMTRALPHGFALGRSRPVDAGARIAIVVSGADQQALTAVAEDVARAVHGVATIPAHAPDVATRTLEVDRARASLVGVNPADADTAVRIALGGEVVTGFSGGVLADRGQSLSVRVTQPIDEHAPLGEQLYVAGNTGALIPLSAVAREEQRLVPAILERRDGARAISLCALAGVADTRSVAAFAGDVSARLKGIKLPAGVRLDVDTTLAPASLCATIGSGRAP